MTDLLSRAEAIKTKLDNGELHWQEYKAIVPELIAEIRRLQAGAQEAETQLQAIVYDDEAPEWAKDYHLLHSALDGPIVDAARKWHLAYRKAQNSNLVRKQQNEQQAAYVARLEAAYLDLTASVLWDRTYMVGCNAKEHRIRAEKAAREALEKIRGGKE